MNPKRQGEARVGQKSGSVTCRWHQRRAPDLISWLRPLDTDREMQAGSRRRGRRRGVRGDKIQEALRKGV